MTRHAGPIVLEVCVDTPDGLRTAVAAGADRIELCASLGVGGLTPSPGLIALARRVAIPVFALIRPRPGDFVYGADEVTAMLADIAAVRAAGLAGVVLGASRSDRSLDPAVLAALCAAAAGLSRTLHRAFDLVPDREAALETAVALGFERILTSGGTTDAVSGRHVLADLVRAARDRLSIMPGGGLRPDTVADLVRQTGAREIHASGKVTVPQDPDLVRWGFASATGSATDRDTIRALRAALDAVGDAAAPARCAASGQ